MSELRWDELSPDESGQETDHAFENILENSVCRFPHNNIFCYLAVTNKQLKNIWNLEVTESRDIPFKANIFLIFNIQNN